MVISGQDYCKLIFLSHISNHKQTLFFYKVTVHFTFGHSYVDDVGVIVDCASGVRTFFCGSVGVVVRCLALLALSFVGCFFVHV